MKFRFAHNNVNVFDLTASIAFYQEALGLQEVRRIDKDDFTIVFLSDGNTNHKLELTWIKGRKERYNLGDNEIHLAFNTSDYDQAYSHHKKMNCICYENKAMNLYFISDPDGYWIEILPMNRG